MSDQRLTASPSKGLEFEILDVFLPTPTTRFKGNQLGVTYIPPGRDLSQTEKQQIANEFNFSESIFVHLPAPAAESETPEWAVDIFTPDSELPFAGHPTIGACFAIQKLRGGDHPLKLRLKAGEVPVTYTSLHGLSTERRKRLQILGLSEAILNESGNAYLIEASIPHAFHLHKDSLSHDELLKIQPALARFADKNSSKRPHILASPAKGLAFVLIPMQSRESLAAVDMSDNVGPEAYLKSDSPGDLIGCYHFHVESSTTIDTDQGPTRQLIVHTRMLIHHANSEDAATGSAACTLSMALALGLFEESWSQEDSNVGLEQGPDDIKSTKATRGLITAVQITQGEQMGRKSSIFVRVVQDSEGRVKEVILAGFAGSFCKGTLA